MPLSLSRPCAIAITAANTRQAVAIQRELDLRQARGQIPSDALVLAVQDPSDARIGSGGATLNAVMAVAAAVSSAKGSGRPCVDDLEDYLVIIIHSGGDSQRSPCHSVCDKAWSSLPSLGDRAELNAPMDLLLDLLFHLHKESLPGMVVASSDVLLLVPRGDLSLAGFGSEPGVTGLGIPMPADYGTRHGVYLTEMPAGFAGTAPVKNFFQKASVEVLRSAGAVDDQGNVALDSGIVFFDFTTTAALLALHDTVFQGCTFVGADSGVAPLRIELYSDMMMALGGGVCLSHEEYLGMATSDLKPDRMRAVREEMWQCLGDVTFRATVAPAGSGFGHLGTTREYRELLVEESEFRGPFQLSRRAHVQCTVPSALPAGAVAVNSVVLGGGADATATAKPLPEGRCDPVIEHCLLRGPWHLGYGSFASAIRSVDGIFLGDDVACQETRTADGLGRVFAIFGVLDDIKASFGAAHATFINRPWDAFLARAGATADDIWPGIAKRNIWTAQVFPILPVVVDDGDGAVNANDQSAGLLKWMQGELPEAAVQEAEAAKALWTSSRRVSLQLILANADISAEFRWRRDLQLRITIGNLEAALASAAGDGEEAVESKQAAHEGKSNTAVVIPVAACDLMLSLCSQLCLDVAPGQPRPGADSTDVRLALDMLDRVASRPGASRAAAGVALAAQGRLLIQIAGRAPDADESGGCCHQAWAKALALVGRARGIGDGATSAAAMADVVAALACVRDGWLHQASTLARAGCHYYGVATMLAGGAKPPGAVVVPALTTMAGSGGGSLGGRCDRRAPWLPLKLLPDAVQGGGAAAETAAAVVAGGVTLQSERSAAAQDVLPLGTGAAACPWNVIAVTAARREDADAYVCELRRRQRRGIIPESTLLIAVPDPAPCGGGGSGGATLNAILVITEALSARAGDTFINGDHLAGQAIVLLHVGSRGPHLMPAFMALPFADQRGEDVATVDVMLQRLASFARSATASGSGGARGMRPRPGIWICNSEALLLVGANNSSGEGAAWPTKAGITVLTVPCSTTYGSRHGVYHVSDTTGYPMHLLPGYVAGNTVQVHNIKYQASEEELRGSGCTLPGDGDKVPLVCGLVFMDDAVAARLLTLYPLAPFTSCTYLGDDNGGAQGRDGRRKEGVSFNLFLDIIACCCAGMDRAEYVGVGGNDGDESKDAAAGGSASGETQLLRATSVAAGARRSLDPSARQILWDHLHGKVQVHAILVEDSQYAFGKTATDLVKLMRSPAAALSSLPTPPPSPSTSSLATKKAPQTLINSVLMGPGMVGAGAVVMHSCLAVDHVAGGRTAGPTSATGSDDTAGGSGGGGGDRSSDAWSIADGACVTGLRSFSGRQLAVPEQMWVQEVALDTSAPSLQGRAIRKNVLVVKGVSDDMHAPFSPGGAAEAAATFLNRPFSEFLGRFGISPGDVWAKGDLLTLWTAKLFVPFEPPPEYRPSAVGASDPAPPALNPQHAGFWMLAGDASEGVVGAAVAEWKSVGLAGRMSLQEIAAATDVVSEFQWQRAVDMRRDALLVGAVLWGRSNTSLVNIFERCAREGRWEILDVLDQIADTALDVAADTATDVAARTMSLIAECLAAFAGNQGGLRSGPAQNPEWQVVLSSLGKGPSQRRGAVARLAALRSKWLNNPEDLIRAARHYEGAAQRLILTSVSTAAAFVPRQPSLRGSLKPGQVIEVEASARIDLAGGWTDTPPLAFEHGGAVTNIAITIDGKRPIGARASRTDEPTVQLVVHRNDGASQVVDCTRVEDLMDYYTPNAPAALLKTVVVFAGVVETGRTGSSGEARTMAEQLADGGIRVESWSNLPTGSGCGTSSILAGCLLRAVGAAMGIEYSPDALVHGVLMVEQMLTTGGGWQDQVGGLIGGAKIGRSASALPLQVTVSRIDAPPGFLDLLGRHLVGIFTGRPRLARNLLQTVIRRWYSRLPEIVATASGLTDNADVAAEAIRNGDIAAVGACFSRYWEQKKAMASGCEPTAVTEMLRVLAPHCHGVSMGGAGGGGFLFAIMKIPTSLDACKALLTDNCDPTLLDISDLSFHDISIDQDGFFERLID